VGITANTALTNIDKHLKKVEKHLERIAIALESIANKDNYQISANPYSLPANPIPVGLEQCRCPKFTAPHIRELGCLDTWTTCKLKTND